VVCCLRSCVVAAVDEVAYVCHGPGKAVGWQSVEHEARELVSAEARLAGCWALQCVAVVWSVWCTVFQSVLGCWA